MQHLKTLSVGVNVSVTAVLKQRVHHSTASSFNHIKSKETTWAIASSNPNVSCDVSKKLESFSIFQI